MTTPDHRHEPPIRVVLPSQMMGNPYVRLLAEALQDIGTIVEHQARSRLWLLRRALRKPRPDVVHLQWQHRYFLGSTLVSTVARTLVFFVQLRLVKARGIAVVWTVHNVVHHESRFPKWELAASKMLARMADVLLVHCRQAAHDVTRAYEIDPGRLRVVAHGHYMDAYPAPVDRLEARRSLGLPETAKIALFFGQIRPYKGVERLMEVFKRIDDPDAHLVIAGEPQMESMRTALMSQAALSGNITLRLNYLDADELVRFVCASDVVVLPYLKSLTSGSGVLAATFARPLIAPRMGCLNEFPDSAAILYEAGSAFGLDEAIDRSLKAPLDEMGVAASEFVSQFPWSRAAEDLRAVYSALLPRN